MITIHNATIEDAQALTELFISARSDMTYLPKLYTDDETLWWMTNIVFKECEVRVARLGNVPVGFLARQQNTIEHLYVAPSQQSRKVGSVLLQEALQNGETLNLWVFQQNARARAFYQRFGFKLLQETDGSRNEEKVPDACYEWRKN